MDLAWSAKASPLNERVYEVVRQIPFGTVASYAQVSALVPGSTPRLVGYAMAVSSLESDLPWHRVINSKGKISIRSSGPGAEIQRRMLEEEGIRFNQKGAVNFGCYGWL